MFTTITGRSINTQLGDVPIDANRKHFNTRHVLHPLAGLVALLLILSVPLHATTIRKVSFTRMCASADAVFCGTVSSIESRRDTATDNIYTYTTFEVDQWIAGESDQDQYTLRTTGGTADGESLIIHGLPRFERDKRYVLFVRGNGQVLCPLVGWRQGCFHVAPDADGHDRVRTFNKRPVTSIHKGRIITAEPIEAGQPRTAAIRDIEPPSALSLDQFIEAVRAERDRASNETESATP